MSDVVHGTPAGYDGGCRGATCWNHKTELMTCTEAHIRYQGDYSYRKLVDAGAAPLTKEEFARDRPVRAARVVVETKAEAAKRAPRVAKVKAVRPRPAPKPRAVAGVAPQAEPVHGTLDGYWRGGCFREDTCPATPSCAQVNLASLEVTADTQARRPRSTSLSSRPRPIQHGENSGFARGCTSETDCPNVAAGGRSCVEGHRAYHRDYTATRKASGGPREHGKPAGYQLGCQDRETCPGGPTGVKCADASLAAEQDRRRRAGVPAIGARVDAGPVREHVAMLRAKGMGILTIAAVAGVGKTLIRTLVYGRADYGPDGHGPRHGEVAKRIDQDKAAQILAVKGPALREVSAKHGTRAGYRTLKCRSKTECPSAAAGGVSCSDANSERNRAYQRTPRERASAPGAVAA